VPLMLRQGGGRVVNISMSEETMVRRGFVPYGPAGAGVEALSRVMAADLEGSSVRVNILLPGGRGTLTGMVPDDVPSEVRARLQDPAVMGPPIVWLASDRASTVQGAASSRLGSTRTRSDQSAPAAAGCSGGVLQGELT
jgi:NAD(P)-dependent dehydrogenase (short-subunit alcohol dehydrogenase family)